MKLLQKNILFYFQFQKKAKYLILFQKKLKPSHRCLCDSFGVSSPKQSAADTSVFIVFLNGERPAMNRPHPLLIIINNASLPIYLPRTHTPLLLIALAPPPTTPPPLHTSYTHGHTCMHIVYTHTHTHNPLFSPIQIPSASAHFPPPLHSPPSISPFFLYLTHSLLPSLQPPSSIPSSPSSTGTRIVPSNPPTPSNLTTQARFALRGPRRQEQKGKSSDFLQRQSNGNAEWNKKNQSIVLFGSHSI